MMSEILPDVSSNNRPWPQIMARYRQPNRWRSVLELAISLAPFILCWGLAWTSLAYGFWWGLVFTIPAAGFLVRLFMIQHDCGHGAFFAHRQADDWAGRIIGILTMTPYDYWRRTHAQHHATAGNLDMRGIGDVETLTVSEYRALSWSGRLRYRLYRHPIVMFGIGPLWLFLLQHRWPVGMMGSGAAPWISTMATNIGIALLGFALVWLLGWQALVLVHLPIVIMAATAGVWLFYVQHQFEETHWAPASDWQFKEAALHGSSYYDLPGILGWLTANIGIHHVHHLASRIPFYRLPEVLRDYPELKAIGRITIGDSLLGVKLVLWDEDRRKLVSFREAAAHPTAA
ncbi:MAG: fatty acid desaturase [Kaiparowitsia implicata GSE-PSE-MK54-09C]|jgi:omega-6 fatty acid desaturase (delta-12 desaturase)|nr:fatty acid desaturase [Kaiparowitsia implicata GSE-PSE-MK54-09C]